MMYTLIGMSLLFIVIGFIVTENNAKYLLAGYNTMSNEERKKVDIKTSITYFRKFHLFLGISYFLIGAISFYFIDENISNIFIAIYPIVAYIYFFATSTKFFSTKKNKIGTYIVTAILIFVAVMFIRDYKETKLVLQADSIEFQGGGYGEIIPLDSIKNIELANNKLKIVRRITGFSAGTIKKGFYKTDKGEVVKLILNADIKPYILITKLNDKKVYYSSKKESNEKLFARIEEARKN